MFADSIRSLPYRQAVVSFAIMSVAAGVTFGSLKASNAIPVLAVAPLAISAGVLGAIVLLRACAGSPAAMGSVLVALAFVNDGAFRIRDPGDIGLDWQNGMKFLLWGSAGIIGACHLRRTSAVLICRGPLLWLLIFIGYAMLSCAYSAAPFYSFTTAFGLLAMLLFASALVDRLSEKQLLLTFALALFVFVLAGWVTYYAIPSLGRSPFITAEGTIIERMCGLAGQANSLGCVLAAYLALVFMLWQRGHIGTKATLLLGGTGLFTLLSADSRTALLAFGIGVAATTLRRSGWSMGGALLGFAAIALLLLSIPSRELFNTIGSLSRSGDPSEMFTLTGRTEIWQFAWDKIVLDPWLGYGYNSSKFILPQFDGLPGLQVDEAHNMLLQNLLGTGIIGTFPLIGMLINLLFNYIRSPHLFRDLFTFLVIVWGVTVAGALGSTPTVMSLAWFCVLIIAAVDAERERFSRAQFSRLNLQLGAVGLRCAE